MSEFVHFELEYVQYDDDGSHIALEYSFWVPLINYFLKCTDSFEIHCWNDESEYINQISSEFGNQLHKKIEGNMTIFSGKLNYKAQMFIINESLTLEKRLKWFSVFLDFDGKSKFNSEHYGTEFVGFDLSENDIKFIKNIMSDSINL